MSTASADLRPLFHNLETKWKAPPLSSPTKDNGREDEGEQQIGASNIRSQPGFLSKPSAPPAFLKTSTTPTLPSASSSSSNGNFTDALIVRVPTPATSVPASAALAIAKLTDTSTHKSMSVLPTSDYEQGLLSWDERLANVKS